MSKILVVEDSPESYRLIQNAIAGLADLVWAKTCAAASAALEKEKAVWDLILLDGHLPDGDGFQLCSMLQTSDEYRRIPVFFLTAKTAINDKVLGFSVGADDYITKPFEPNELRARVEAKIRRRQISTESSHLVTCGPLEINKTTQRAVIVVNGLPQPLNLTLLELKLLLFFANNPDVDHSRDKLLTEVWGTDSNIFARNVDTHVSKVRAKLGAHQHLLVSTHGVGYKMIRQQMPSRLAADGSDAFLKTALPKSE